MHAGFGSVDDITMLDLQSSESAGSVMFEGTDSVTNLRHRWCWMISSEAGRIRRIAAWSSAI